MWNDIAVKSEVVYRNDETRFRIVYSDTPLASPANLVAERSGTDINVFWTGGTQPDKTSTLSFIARTRSAWCALPSYC